VYGAPSAANLHVTYGVHVRAYGMIIALANNGYWGYYTPVRNIFNRYPDSLSLDLES
jgi:hypothetical protein